MQMRAFRGSRTVMSFRLCSRAPWTISSSAAMGAPLYLPNVCSYSRLPPPARYSGGEGAAGRRRRTIGKANGLVESARGVGFALGPAAGGALAAGAGTKVALLIDAASFLLIALALLWIPVRRHAVRVEGTVLRARDGLTLLFGRRGLATAMLARAATLVFMSASIPGDFAYTTDDLHKGA